MSEYIIFWGCLISTRFLNIEAASRKVFEKLGVKLLEAEGFSCCPEPVISKVANRDLWLSLAARNLSLAEEKKKELIIICNGCYETLYDAETELKHDKEIKEKINGILRSINREFKGEAHIYNFLEILVNKIGIDKIKKHIVNPLNNLNVAMHYGCHLFTSKDPDKIWEKPQMFDQVVTATGAKIVKYGEERLCCGYPLGQYDYDYAIENRIYEKFKAISKAKADCIVVTCPACYYQFDFEQKTVEKRFGEEFNIPVIHVMELLAMAFGMETDVEEMLKMHRTKATPILMKIRGK